jgi:alpha-1,2-mannosyltransferase
VTHSLDIPARGTPTPLLNARRIRAHALILAVCLWGSCALDYSKSGLFDRAGNIKFQDFLQFPISARLIAQGRAADLYDDQVLAEGIRGIVGNTPVHLRYFYGPQVALPFRLLGRFSFLTQAEIWMALSLLIYLVCIAQIYRHCGGLRSHGKLVAICAIAYPPLFHFFMRGHLSAVLLLFVTAGYLAFRGQREWLAGIALGFLIVKPQFLVAIPFILLLAKAWKVFSGLVISAGAQLAFSYFYFGEPVMRAYFSMLGYSAERPASTELSQSAIQMHSLCSFWELLIPWPRGVWSFYLPCALAVMVLAAAIWRSSSPRSIRYSALILASVLVNPHIYIYDLLALAPIFLLLADWCMKHAQHRFTPALGVLLYLAFLLPLFGPLARWTHLQFSVIVFVGLLCTLYRMDRVRVPRAFLTASATS